MNARDWTLDELDRRIELCQRLVENPYTDAYGQHMATVLSVYEWMRGEVGRHRRTERWNRNPGGPDWSESGCVICGDFGRDECSFVAGLASALGYPGDGGAVATEVQHRCPTCNSPAPNLHPAMQYEGEVNLCSDPWHAPTGDGERGTPPVGAGESEGLREPSGPAAVASLDTGYFEIEYWCPECDHSAVKIRPRPDGGWRCSQVVQSGANPEDGESCDCPAPPQAPSAHAEGGWDRPLLAKWLAERGHDASTVAAAMAEPSDFAEDHAVAVAVRDHERDNPTHVCRPMTLGGNHWYCDEPDEECRWSWRPAPPQAPEARSAEQGDDFEPPPAAPVQSGGAP